MNDESIVIVSEPRHDGACGLNLAFYEKRMLKNYDKQKKLCIFAHHDIYESCKEKRTINQSLILWILKEEEKARILRIAVV